MKRFVRWLEMQIIRWDLRSTPLCELKEMYVLLIMAGRRCSYDMLHCASDSKDGTLQDLWHSRAYMWRQVFEVDSGKKYRHELHHRIYALEERVATYEKILKENNFPFTPFDDIPF